ncbi:short chain enoyl-CoA hydratase [Trinickia symbiotica]|uniref:Enoyl-CoA hydratase n=1 Tax=Trinickia symbiotica TaxID=863227 RepID=A0A2N7XA65_9BURK|nr:enoyl-CoA hydratase-related protein [Trinickia symbiotica]PMS38432.1 enoyl-CoA hydratase [Trinickia symbiotica]PPK46444.1 short chain enoyl-CoA hydratase [Trinickia symbiotica]
MSVELAYRGDIAVITLNRPEAMNALNAGMIDRIGSLIDEAAAASPRALLFTGAGGKAFCAGADIKEMLERSKGEHRAAARAGQCTFAKLDSLPFPSLAVIQGVALGGGLELAMACTFRIAVAGARFGLPEIKLGLIPGYGGTQRLPLLIGKARALEMIASGRLVDTEEAARLGLVHRVVDAGEPVELGIRFLDGLGVRFPAALSFARTAVDKALTVSLEDGLKLEADLFTAATQTTDAGEGMHAFLEKRKPAFTGR